MPVVFVAGWAFLPGVVLKVLFAGGCLPGAFFTGCLCCRVLAVWCVFHVNCRRVIFD